MMVLLVVSALVLTIFLQRECTWLKKTTFNNIVISSQNTSPAPNRSRVHRPVVVAIDVCGVSVMPKPSIRDIGVEIDDTMSRGAWG